MNGTVTKSYESAYPDPIRLRVGAVVAWQPKESEWKGWAWCTDEAGREGWVPEVCIEKHGSQAIALQDYSAVELTVAVGETLELLSEQAGWLWCRDSKGACGCVPKGHVEVA